MTLLQPHIAAAVQFEPKLLDVSQNLNVALQLTFEAAAKGAKLIVLPELAISGYVMRNPSEAMQCAQVKEGYQSQAFVDITRRYNCHVALGYVELCEGMLYNSAVLVGPGGPVMNVRKHQLYGSDFLWANPGDQLNAMHEVAATDIGRIGLLVCRDVKNKHRDSYAWKNENFKFYPKGSVDHICLLTNWSGGGYGYPDAGWMGLAEETNANVVVSNRVGKERDIVFKGGSCIIDKTMHVWTNGSSFFAEAVVGGALLV